MQQIIWLSLAISIIFVSIPGYSCGKLSVRAGSLSYRWDPERGHQVERLQVYRSKLGQPCDFFVTFSKGKGRFSNRTAQLGNQNISYQISAKPTFHSSHILKDLTATRSPNHFAMGQFSSGRNPFQTLSFHVNFPFERHRNPKIPKSGIYLDQLIVSVYSGRPGRTITPDQVTAMTLSVFVPRIVDLSLGPSGRPFREYDRSEFIDFGTLRKGVARTVDLRVITNAGYSISLSSENNGVLRNSIPSLRRSVVPYTLKLNSQRRGLKNSQSSPILLARRQGTTGTFGHRHTLKITVGGARNKMAGVYQDTLTLVVRSLE